MEAEAWQFWFGRHAFFGAHPTPTGDVVWFVNAPRPEITVEERAATSNAEWQETLVGLFLADRAPAAALINAGRLELAADNTYDLGHVPVWHRNRMIIIGDAATHAAELRSGGIHGPRRRGLAVTFPGRVRAGLGRRSCRLRLLRGFPT